MEFVHLRVENQVNPLGIDEPSPRFSWCVEGTVPGFMQSAWEIRVFSGRKTVWDSGKVSGGESIQIPYQGPELAPMRDYSWCVRVYDQNGKASLWSLRESFSTGRGNTPWQGKWISPGLTSGVLQPAAMIRAPFTLKKKPVRARLYATAQGLYTASANGKGVTEDLFTPGWTVYARRVQYQTYDVLKLLRPGKNVLGFQLNEGWFGSMISRRWNGLLNPMDNVPALRAELRLEFADGSEQVIASSAEWIASLDGPVRYSDIYEGEAFDSRKIIEDWNQPDYDDSAWHPVREIRDYDNVKIETQTGTSVRCAEVFKPVKKTHPQPDCTVFDFGQNLSGRERLRICLPENARVYIKHGEMLNADGTVYTDNLRRAHAGTLLIGCGRPFTFEPTFTFYGFRYIQMLDTPDFDENDISVAVLHSDMDRTGYFGCSEQPLNRLFLNALWGQFSNYFDVPTDCPQRDERLGWTGDTQVFIPAAVYNCDVESFFERWLRCLEDSRNTEGDYPTIAPFNFPLDDRRPRGWFSAAGWSDAGIICPYMIYQTYGNTRVLERHYPAMKKYMQLMVDTSKDMIRRDVPHLGDWLNMNARTSQELLSTAFFGWDALLFSRMAAALGNKKDAQWAAKLYEKIRKVCRRFFTPEGELLEKTQTAALLLLHFGLVPEEYRQKTLEFLVHDITVTHKNHLSTGFLGTPYLAEVLTENGYWKEAYNLVQQDTFPSWLFPVKNGATTIWERWNSWTPEDGFGDVSMNSFNHYAYGAVVSWFYRRIGGIYPLEPGYRKFAIEPVPGGTLRFAETKFRSPYGWIESKWALKGKSPVLEVVIPPNTQAVIRWQGGEWTLGSGHYRVKNGKAELLKD